MTCSASHAPHHHQALKARHCACHGDEAFQRVITDITPSATCHLKRHVMMVRTVSDCATISTSVTVEQQPGTSRSTAFQSRAAPPQPTFRQQSSRRQQSLNESWERSTERQRTMAPPRPRQPVDSQPSVSTGQTPPLVGGTAVRARSPCRVNVPVMSKEEQIRRVLNAPDMRAIAKRMSDRTMRFTVDVRVAFV